MSETIRNALLFLISTLFELYLFILIIRLVLVWIRSDYFNPLVQFVVKFTNYLIKPIRNIIPNIGRLETATLITIFVLELIKFTLISLLSVGVPNFFGILILAVGGILKLLIEIFFYGIILSAIMSWVQPHNPMNRVLHQFVSPIIRPIQRIIPPVGGIDISPIPALILLQLLIIVLVGPLLSTGWQLAVG